MGKSIQSFEGRSGRDRRKKQGISIRYLVGFGSRRTIRREEDRNRIFLVDRYSSVLFVAILAVILLSITDGFLTLILIGHGAYEVNPIMAYMLDISPAVFLASKYALTCMATMIVLVLRNVVIRRTRFPAHSLLYLFIMAFATVVGWELYLLCYVI